MEVYPRRRAHAIWRHSIRWRHPVGHTHEPWRRAHVHVWHARLRPAWEPLGHAWRELGPVIVLGHPLKGMHALRRHSWWRPCPKRRMRPRWWLSV